MLVTNNKLSQIAGCFIASSLLVLCSSAVTAGTILEVKNDGELTTMLTDGRLARLNMVSAEYVIIDYRKQLVKVVDQQNHQVVVLDVAAAAKSIPANTKVHVSLKKLGSAQRIAGYETNKFEYTANGRSCGVILASKKAYQEKGIQDLMSAMQTMIKKQRAVLGGFAGFIDDCTLADMQLAEHVSNIGLPMRTSKNGVVETEIKRIRVDVTLPEETFLTPAGYKIITMEDKIKQASKGWMHAPQGKPSAGGQQGVPQGAQFKDMMRQMQQAGQLTPEMMEQMRGAQQMMQQYQQQR